MDLTEIMNALKQADLYELHRLRVALKNEIESPERIRTLRQCFSTGDEIAYFNVRKNALCRAFVLEKNAKRVVVKNVEDHQIWHIPYCAINLDGKEGDISAQKSEKLTKNHFKVGELVGFLHDGKQFVGHIEKLNHKTASLITQHNGRWRVSFNCLSKVLEGEYENSSLRSTKLLSEKIGLSVLDAT